jgi:hypothetical protein
MSREVCFSFSTQEEKQEFTILAARRGLTLSQFCRWCVYKYRRDRDANTAGARSRRASGTPASGSTP